jgi:predicted DNA-binding transcriptional regulator AlpA
MMFVAHLRTEILSRADVARLIKEIASKIEKGQDADVLRFAGQQVGTFSVGFSKRQVPMQRTPLTINEVVEMVKVHRATIDRLVKAGKFPEGTFVSPNRRIWYLDQIIKWQRTGKHYPQRKGKRRR